MKVTVMRVKMCQLIQVIEMKEVMFHTLLDRIPSGCGGGGGGALLSGFWVGTYCWGSETFTLCQTTCSHILYPFFN